VVVAVFVVVVVVVYVHIAYSLPKIYEGDKIMEDMMSGHVACMFM
jgi:hypothetical protein